MIPRPWPVAEWILRTLVGPGELRHTVVGDLREEHARIAGRHGLRWAHVWHLGQALHVGGLMLLRRWAKWARESAAEGLEGLEGPGDGTSSDGRGGKMGEWMREWVHDVRLALRVHRHHPGAAVLVILTLGLGIGGVTSVAAVMKGVLLTPLPYDDADELMLLAERRGEDPLSVSYPNFQDWRSRSHAFEALAAYQFNSFTLLGGERAVRARGYRVSGELFDLLGVPPELGRTFTSEEDAPGGPAVVVLSHGLWQDAFGGDHDVVGSDAELDGESYRVVGVMPAGFDFWSGADVWTPLGRLVAGSELESRGLHAGVYVVGRRASGVSEEAAREEMNGIAAELRRLHPDANRGVAVRVESLREAVLGDADRTLLLLMAAVSLLLLVACLNVANLLQARNAERAREVAVRLALGSGRRRLVRKFLVEALVLAVAGGGLGLAMAWAIPEIVRATHAAAMPRLELVAVDPLLMGLCLALSLFVGTGVAILPALSVAIGGVPAAGERVTGGRGVARVREGLVAGQVAVSVLLLIGAGLLVRSLERIHAQELGFRTEDVVSFRVDLPSARYGWGDRARFFDELLGRIGGLGSVSAAGVVEPLPLSGRDRSQSVYPEGRAYSGSGDLERIDYAPATAGYFDAMGIPLLEGRLFRSSDDGDPSVALVSASTAERFWPGQSAVGKTLVGGGPDSGNPPLTVVGVVGDVRHYGVRGPVPNQMYFHYAQLPLGGTVVVRVAREGSLDIVPTLRRMVAEVDPEVPVYSVATLEDLFDRTVAGERTVTWALGFFALFALLLTLLGVYGVVARSVVQRTREMAIRAALGARQRRLVLTLVLGAAVPLLLGILLGGVLALGTARTLESLLFGVVPLDPLIYGLVTGCVMLTGLAAAAIPSLRVLRLKPAAPLREE